MYPKVKDNTLFGLQSSPVVFKHLEDTKRFKILMY